MTPPAHLPPEAYHRLLEISRALAATLDLDPLLTQIVHAAADLSDAEAASILLYDPQSRELHFQTATNLTNGLKKGTAVPLDHSIAGLALKRKTPIRRVNVRQDADHYGRLDEITHVQTRTLIAVPLIANGQPVGVLEAINKREGAFTDADEEILTALAAHAAVAIQNARLFQQSDLIAELVHEIRTPLGAILAASQLLRMPQISEEQRQRTIETIEQQARYLNELTTTFLDMARLESGRVRFERNRIDVGALLQEVARMFAAEAQKRGIQMEINIPENLQPLVADRAKIKQVLINLVSNALKYNRPHGKVRLAAYHEDGHISITVSDTGPGIAPQHLKHLFGKFYRVPGSEKQARGTGLGLYICKRIVEAHRGEMRVKSTLGQGTTFIVTLPLREEDEQP